MNDKSSGDKACRSNPERPSWIRVKGLRADVQASMISKLAGCNTVCMSAKCPNLGECFTIGVATFMIGGRICTRACRFCGVRHGKPDPLDPEEPDKVAESVERLGLRYVVITSVARDDLEDGGASHFVAVISAIRRRKPEVGVEVLIPDFGGSETALRTLLEASPNVLNHNIETVRRLTPIVRSKATYDRSLELLERARRIAPGIPTKSGLMVGLGESFEEVIETLEDLRRVGCSMLTIGQYLQPRAHGEIPVARYWAPEEFEDLERAAYRMGFKKVAAGPFVRSSYLAEEMAKGTSILS